MADKDPLIEMAEYREMDAALVEDLPEAADYELRQARILRAAAEVIEAAKDGWEAITEQEETQAASDMGDALAAYEAACREVGK